MATLKDISKLVNTSEATVSLVLNGHFHRVTPETRARIEAAAQQLGYRPNRIAQSLAKGKTMNIMVILNDLTNPFYATLASKVGRKLGEVGYHVSPVETLGSAEREAKLLDLASQATSDAVLCLEALPHQDPAVYAAISERMPFVIRHQAYQDLKLGFPGNLTRVGIDYGKGFEDLLAHLRTCGVHRAGLLMHDEHDPSLGTKASLFGRFVGTVLAGNSNWLCTTSVARVSDESPLEAWYTATLDLLKRTPNLDALFVHHLQAVPPVFAALESLGFCPGVDLAVASIDDDELARWTRPGVTVIAEDLDRTADALVDKLTRKLKADKAVPSVQLKTKLIPRDSTRLFRPR